MIAQTVPAVGPVGNILEEGEGGLAGTPLLPGPPMGVLTARRRVRVIGFSVHCPGNIYTGTKKFRAC